MPALLLAFIATHAFCSKRKRVELPVEDSRSLRSRSRIPQPPPPPIDELEALLPGWTEYWAPTADGNRRPYYHHQEYGVQWHRPIEKEEDYEIFDAKEFQNKGIDLINKAKEGSNLKFVGYNLDRHDVVNALIEAHRRRVNVRVCLDERTNFEVKSIHQKIAVDQLVQAGVPLHFVAGEEAAEEFKLAGRKMASDGKSFPGKLHAKALFVEDFKEPWNNRLLTGSCNWTTGSRTNIEIATLLYLNDASSKSVRHFFNATWLRGRTYDQFYGRPVDGKDLATGDADAARDDLNAAPGLARSSNWHTVKGSQSQ